MAETAVADELVALAPPLSGQRSVLGNDFELFDA
jgi:hypothetical protein